MADIVARNLADPHARVLVYAGLNHVFTHYYQPEMPRAKKVESFMDRMGNLLWRKYGEDAFLIVMHHPWRCVVNGEQTRCVPAGSSLECAAALQNRAIGFDLQKSPFAGARLAGFEYALGYADLRFIDIADGYVWQRPVAEYRSATLIPLAEFAPDEAALQQVSQHPPFGDVPGVSRAELERQWKEQQEWLNNAEATRGWVAITCNTEVKR